MSTDEESSGGIVEVDDNLSPNTAAKDRADNWLPDEITALFTVWKKYVAELDRASHKRIVYKKMSDKLKVMGIERNHLTVQIKINKLKGLYKKNMPSSKGGSKSKWKYWKSVDEILGEPDTDESSWDEDAPEEVSTESEASEPVQTKKMRAVTRSTPKKDNSLIIVITKPKPKVKAPPAPKQERVRKPPPPDEVLDNLLRQDKKLKDHTLKLINLYKDTASRITHLQRSSTDNLTALATEFERYLKSRKNDAIQELSVEDKVNALLDNDLTNVALNSLLPNVFKNEALMPLLKTVLSQFAPPPPTPTPAAPPMAHDKYERNDTGYMH